MVTLNKLTDVASIIVDKYKKCVSDVLKEDAILFACAFIYIYCTVNFFCRPGDSSSGITRVSRGESICLGSVTGQRNPEQKCKNLNWSHLGNYSTNTANLIGSTSNLTEIKIISVAVATLKVKSDWRRRPTHSWRVFRAILVARIITEETSLPLGSRVSGPSQCWMRGMVCRKGTSMGTEGKESKENGIQGNEEKGRNEMQEHQGLEQCRRVFLQVRSTRQVDVLKLYRLPGITIKYA